MLVTDRADPSPPPFQSCFMRSVRGPKLLFSLFLYIYFFVSFVPQQNTHYLSHYIIIIFVLTIFIITIFYINFWDNMHYIFITIWTWLSKNYLLIWRNLSISYFTNNSYNYNFPMFRIIYIFTNQIQCI